MIGIVIKRGLAAILFPIYAATLVYNALLIIHEPRLDLQLRVLATDHAYLIWTIPGGTLWEAGARPGQRVVALDGEAPRVEQSGSWQGQRVTIETASGQPITLDARTMRHERNSWPLLALSPWFMLLGTLIYLRATDRAVAHAAFALFASAAFGLALAPAAVEDRLVAAAAEFAIVTFFAAYFLQFFLTFPTRYGSTPLRVVLLIPPTIVSVLGVLAMRHAWLYERAALLRLGILAIYLLLGVCLVLNQAMRDPGSDKRRGIGIIALGTVASTLPFLLLYVMPALIAEAEVVAAEYAILPLAFLPASFAYAILRHNALNVPLLQRWLVHGVVWLALVIPYILIALAGYWLLSPFSDLTRHLVLSASLVALAGLTFGCAYARIKLMVDRCVFKDSYNYRVALHQLSRDLSMANNLDTLSDVLPNRLKHLLNVEFVALLIHDREGKTARAHRIVGAHPPTLLDESTAALNRMQNESESICALDAYPQVLLIPLRVYNVVVGGICIGPKITGEPFRQEDETLLTTLSSQVAAIVTNAELIDDLRSKVAALNMVNERLQCAQEEERIRLSADIHDEPLQAALHLQRQLATASERDETLRKHASLCQTLIDQLRRVCMTMRPATLDDLGLFAALDALATEQSERFGVSIYLNIDSAMIDTMITPSAEHVLYRTAQEAISNSLRHAEAQIIEIILRQQDDFVQLLVRDDGSGFTMPNNLNELISQGHLGLVGLCERVQRIGGRLSVASTPEGTIVQLNIPLKAVQV